MLNPVSRQVFTRWFGAAALLSLSSLSVLGQYDPDWERNFRVGVLMGLNVKGSFRTSGDSQLPGQGPGQPGVSGRNHFFDNGYVRVDDTGNAGGYTTFWGYESPDQVSGDRLNFTSTRSFSTSANARAEEDAVNFGFDLAYGGILWRGDRLRVGWEFGFGLLPIILQDDSRLSATITRHNYSFQIPDGVVVPGAPYNGSSSGYDQPLLNDVATFEGEDTIDNVTVTGKRELDVTLYAFKLGPTVFWDLHPSFGLALSGGPALGFVSGNYHFDEQIGEARNRGSFGASDMVYGGYVSATVTYHATLNGDFYLSAQYMPLGTASFSKGTRTAKLDLSGAVYVAAGINWPF